MPFRLCNCDKDKLNKVIDQVKTLSNTVDELREDIDSLKLRFIESNNDENSINSCGSRYRERRSKIGASTFKRLKKCLEKNFIPIVSMDGGYRVRKKCQQIFAQSPKARVPFPARLSSRESSIDRNSKKTLQSCTKNACRTPQSCQTSKFHDEKIIKPRVKRTSSISMKKCRQDVCKVTKKAPTASSTSSTECVRKNRDKTFEKQRCSREFCKVTTSPGKPECKIRKRKTTGTTTLDLTTQSGDRRIKECGKNTPKCSKIVRCVNFVDKCQKSVAVEAKTSVGSSRLLASSTSLTNSPSCKIIYKQVKGDYNEKTLRNRSNGKTSKLPRCSPNCPYVKKLQACPRDVSTNTFFKNINNEEICNDILRKKRIASQETQTFSADNVEDYRYNVRGRFQATPKWFRDTSLTSLTSYSPSLVGDVSLEKEEFNGGRRQCMRKDNRERLKFGRKIIEETGKKNDIVEEDEIQYPKKHDGKNIDEENESQSDDASIKLQTKRTYVISSDIPSMNLQPSFECNYQKNHEDSSCLTEASMINENNFRYSCRRKTSKKPKVPSKVCPSYKLPTGICQSVPKEKQAKCMRKTVCTNRATKNYLPKFPRWPRKSSRNDKIECSRFSGYESSSSRELSDESSLTSKSNFYEKSYPDSVTAKYCRNISSKNNSKNETKLCSSPEKKARKFTVCESLSGSVRSISCESL